MSISTISRILNSLSKVKQSNSMKDSMIVGLIGGTIGAVAIELLNISLGKKLFFGKIASSMIVHPLRSMSLKNILLGELMHLTVGAGIGSVIAVVFQKTGKNLAMVKGTFVSLFAWIGLHNLGNRMDLFSIEPHSTKSHYFAFVQHLIYGITTSAVIKYIANPVTFLQPSISKSQSHPFLPSEIEPEIYYSQGGQFKYPTA